MDFVKRYLLVAFYVKFQPVLLFSFNFQINIPHARAFSTVAVLTTAHSYYCNGNNRIPIMVITINYQLLVLFPMAVSMAYIYRSIISYYDNRIMELMEVH